jgi:hypothetical protein
MSCPLCTTAPCHFVEAEGLTGCRRAQNWRHVQARRGAGRPQATAKRTLAERKDFEASWAVEHAGAGVGAERTEARSGSGFGLGPGPAPCSGMRARGEARASGSCAHPGAPS